MRLFYFLILGILFASCGIVKQAAKKELHDGVYTQLENGQKHAIYLENQGDTLQFFVHNKLGPAIPAIVNSPKNYLLHHASFDIDVITIPVKYRTSVQSIPGQLTSDINASLYLGWRNDLFKIRYPLTPTGKYKRRVEHIGFSFGGLLGIGNSVINSDVSSLPISNEYQGIVFSKGIAGIMAINNFTVGLAYGTDQLLDSNKSTWLFEQKPWFGLAIGLNLN